MTAAALVVSETIYEVPLDAIVRGDIPNYRQRKGDEAKFDELVASVRSRGVLQPLVLRKRSDDLLELVFGFRRYAAASKAGRTWVPCVIREYDDEALHDARLIENGARENPHPLDEAEEYAAALKRGHSAQAIAEKLGQSVRYVLQRLALNELCSAGQLALEQGYISLDVAVLIARLPGEKTQNAALDRVNCDRGGYTEGVMLLETARAEIESHVMLDLSDAPFRLDDAELVPAAGPCTTCRKRTGNQAELFGDASSGDLCIDAPCHRSKLDALHQLKVKQAKVEGVAVVPAKKAREVIDGAFGFALGELVRLDARVQVGKAEKEVRQVFGKELPPITIAQDPRSGLTVELVPRAALQAAVGKAEKAAPADPKKADGKGKAEREAERLQAEVRRRVLIDMVSTAESVSFNVVARQDVRDLLGVLLQCAINTVHASARKAVADRRGCPRTVAEGEATAKRGKGKKQEQLLPEQRLLRLLPTLEPIQLTGLLLELLVSAGAPGKWSEPHESYANACTVLGVNTTAITAAVKAEAKEKAKPQRRAVGLPQPVKGVKSKRKVKHPEPAAAERSTELDPEETSDGED
jgi:ParB/RepB/Spo0J family partition protein